MARQVKKFVSIVLLYLHLLTKIRNVHSASFGGGFYAGADDFAFDNRDLNATDFRSGPFDIDANNGVDEFYDGPDKYSQGRQVPLTFNVMYNNRANYQDKLYPNPLNAPILFQNGAGAFGNQLYLGGGAYQGGIYGPNTDLNTGDSNSTNEGNTTDVVGLFETTTLPDTESTTLGVEPDTESTTLEVAPAIESTTLAVEPSEVDTATISANPGNYSLVNVTDSYVPPYYEEGSYLMRASDSYNSNNYGGTHLQTQVDYCRPRSAGDPETTVQSGLTDFLFRTISGQTFLASAEVNRFDQYVAINSRDDSLAQSGIDESVTIADFLNEDVTNLIFQVFRGRNTACFIVNDTNCNQDFNFWSTLVNNFINDRVVALPYTQPLVYLVDRELNLSDFPTDNNNIFRFCQSVDRMFRIVPTQDLPQGTTTCLLTKSGSVNIRVPRRFAWQ